jgi:hypothetical protein
METSLEITDLSKLAADYINTTNRHLFLTGKAGTGKTTFLQNLAQHTHKRYIIVAPTGIAALNAGGVTIHSQFLLPLGSYLPENGKIDPESQAKFYDPKQLTIRNPLNSKRKQVLRDIDLLIIDEVSMLRADILDAMDYRLRRARGNMNKPFGGVQLLLIGDLFQLPPIVKPDEWRVLRSYYPSMHFFNSRALKKQGYVYVELEKVFRQEDEKFIEVLNKLRNNACKKEDIDFLNQFYKKEIPENTITLTTHNRDADRINKQSLDALDKKEFTFKAEVKGEFPENLYPLPEELVLKEGAQIMFVKNDNRNQDFYNGKLARVIELGTDHIRVKMSGEDRELDLEPMDWNNIKYEVDDNKELKEDIAGTFSQYPIKLAWAITVHKSQGLTFDRAVIDVGKAFAPGQVYVALSRLRSLDGLILNTRINPGGISTDVRVQEFKNGLPDTSLEGELKDSQLKYLEESLLSTFDFAPILKQIEYVERKSLSKMEFEEEELRNALPSIRKNLKSEDENTRIFGKQMRALIHKGDFDKLYERIEKGSQYYIKFAYDILYQVLLHKEDVAQFARTKTYVNGLNEVDQLIMRSVAKLQKVRQLSESILQGTEMPKDDDDKEKRQKMRDAFLEKVHALIDANPRKGAGTTGKRKKKAQKTETGATYQETFRMVREGLSIHQIAVKRSLADSTIEGHVARGISEGKLKASQFMDEKEIKEITERLLEQDDAKLSDVYAGFKGKYSYGKLRMVQAALPKKTAVK